MFWSIFFGIIIAYAFIGAIQNLDYKKATY